MNEALRYPELSEDMKARGFGAMLRIFWARGDYRLGNHWQW